LYSYYYLYDDKFTFYQGDAQKVNSA